ncbi:hypothetical protein [Lacimonas salitolerans]|uniref:Uncharacterized protein n=1 Tax=Lacimonas salitolerans TaxID=1323750 RepID=A0ABW4EGM0_9RHOB
MTDRMEISATEAGLVRVFAIDLPDDRIDDLGTPDAPDVDAIRQALGATALSPQHVDLLRLADLGEMGLDGYLVDGLGVAEPDIASDRTRLRGLRGHALVLPSAALMDTAQTLTPRGPLRWVGTYAEPRATTDFTPLRSQAAQDTADAQAPRKPPPSDAAMSGRVATIVLLVLFALVAVMVWIAG